MTNASVKMICDYLETLKTIEHLLLHKRNRVLRGSIYEKIKKLENNRYCITIQ